jgi:hypothetical protein
MQCKVQIFEISFPLYFSIIFARVIIITRGIVYINGYFMNRTRPLCTLQISAEF